MTAPPISEGAPRGGGVRVALRRSPPPQVRLATSSAGALQLTAHWAVEQNLQCSTPGRGSQDKDMPFILKSLRVGKSQFSISAHNLPHSYGLLSEKANMDSNSIDVYADCQSKRIWTAAQLMTQASFLERNISSVAQKDFVRNKQGRRKCAAPT